MILTEEKAAFAAEHHGVILQYLKERGLSTDEYYDTVVFAFLDCVISGKDNFKKRAYAAMDRAVAAVKAESEGNIISLFCNDDCYRTVAETLADELNRALKISEHTLKALKETEPEYKRKSEVLESYRNSFPCLVQPGYTVFNVIRTEVVPDKYSRWLIVGEFGDELWKTTIIRRDMQTYGEMLTLISKTETPDGITELNEQNALPWE